MAGIRLQGSSGNLAEVDADGNLLVTLPSSSDPTQLGAALFFAENDPGAVTGTPAVASPEVDADARLRIGNETLVDAETFFATAQNTGKFNLTNTTMTGTFTAGQFTTNGTSITTTTTAVTFGTYAYYQVANNASTYCEMEAGFTAQPTTNTIVDFGMFIRGAANPYTPANGVFFRLNASGLFGVASFAGVETPTAVLDFTYVNSQRYRFIVEYNVRWVRFWIDDVLYATLLTPVGQSQPSASPALPFSVRHAISGGAAGAVLQFQLGAYDITIGGPSYARSLSEFGSASLGTYQGLTGGTMGSLANYANSANPGAVVPTNTTAAAASVGLGGQTWETDTVAATTDCIILSYQVPAGTALIQGRRLRVNGVKIDSYVQTVLGAGAGYVAQWSLAFGHTAVSLATPEAATTKAPRRIALGVQNVPSTAAANTVLSTVQMTFQNPVYVDPGQFIAVVKKKVGAAPASGTIAHVVTYDYSWE